MAFSCSPGPYLSKVVDCEEYQGTKLCTDRGVVPDFGTLREKLVASVVKCLEKRFADIEEGILGATKLAELSTWPPVFNEETNGMLAGLSVLLCFCLQFSFIVTNLSLIAL